MRERLMFLPAKIPGLQIGFRDVSERGSKKRHPPDSCWRAFSQGPQSASFLGKCASVPGWMAGRAARACNRTCPSNRSSDWWTLGRFLTSEAAKSVPCAD